VSPATIADAIVHVAQDVDLADRLRAAGRQNVERYSWDTLELAAQRMVEPFTGAVAS
jgi:glycosyltransferase involved in cell wall biosynthesis